MIPLSNAELEMYGSLNGGRDYCLRELAQLMAWHRGSAFIQILQDQTVSLEPDMQECIKVFCFMFERLDAQRLEELSSQCKAAQDACNSAWAELKGHRRKQAVDADNWLSIAKRAKDQLREIQDVECNWFETPLLPAVHKDSLSKMRDPRFFKTAFAFASIANFAKYRPELAAEMLLLLASVDQQIRTKGETEIIDLMRTLYQTLADVTRKYEDCSQKEEHGGILIRQHTEAKNAFLTSQQVLEAELGKMQPSGLQAWFRLAPLFRKAN